MGKGWDPEPSGWTRGQGLEWVTHAMLLVISFMFWGAMMLIGTSPTVYSSLILVGLFVIFLQNSHSCLTLNTCFPSFYIQLWHCCVSCKLLFCFAFLSNLWNSHGFTLINLCLDASIFCIPILSNFYFSLFSCKICGICMVWNWLIYIGMLFFKGFLFVKFLCHCCISCFPFFFFLVSI